MIICCGIHSSYGDKSDIGDNFDPEFPDDPFQALYRKFNNIDLKTQTKNYYDKLQQNLENQLSVANNKIRNNEAFRKNLEYISIICSKQ